MTTLTATIRGLTIGAGTPYRFTAWPDVFSTAEIRDDDDPMPHDDGVIPGPDRLGAKRFTLEVDIQGTSPTDAKQFAKALATAFAPAHEMEWLTINIDGEEFAYRGRCRGVIAGLNRRFLSGTVAERCRFVATDPLRYGPEQAASIDLSDIGAGFVLPVILPAIIDGTTGAGEASVPNDGDHSVPFLATLTGPLGNPRLTHVETGQFVRVLTTLGAGETAVIDSRLGTVLLGGVARPDLLGAGSTVFRLLPGPNTLRLTADTGTGTASITWRSGSA